MRCQRGASLFMTLAFLILLGFAIMVAVQVCPPMLTNMSVNSAMKVLPEKLKQESDGGGSDQIFVETVKRILVANLKVNNIYDISMDTLQFERQDDDAVKVLLNYEVRKHLFANVDVVVHFENSVLVTKRAS